MELTSEQTIELTRKRNERINKIRETKRNLSKKKKIILKSIFKIYRTLNPIKEIRILDFVFPIGGNFSTSSLDSKDSDVFHSQWYAMYNSFKRISRIERDTETDEYTYFLEERWPQKQIIWKGFENLTYFTQYLQSLANVEAYNLSVWFDSYIKSVGDMTRNIAYDYSDSKKERVWISQIDKEHQKDFLNFPYYALEESYN